MSTDVDVQFFSNLNGLTLGNNWGDLIRLLDKTLVTGIDFTQIISASIDAQGDVHITLYSAHNATLLQVVELTGFTPASLNQKYRIKGVPSTAQLILKPKNAISETSITTVGNGKLASLGYEIIFRDSQDVKRVYRAKNPKSNHPFIRIDESLTSPDGVSGVYTSTYAKYAMVGLLSDMTHIDDYERSEIKQLPQGTPAQKWGVSGVGANCVRGTYRWYWAHVQEPFIGTQYYDSTAPANGGRLFLICGDKDAFYFHRTFKSNGDGAQLTGIGLINSAYSSAGLDDWFVHCSAVSVSAGSGYNPYNMPGSNPFFYAEAQSSGYMFLASNTNSSHTAAYPIVPDYNSGKSTMFSGSSFSALEIPIVDGGKKLRGSFKHAFYSGHDLQVSSFTKAWGANSALSEKSMYVFFVRSNACVFYLGELE